MKDSAVDVSAECATAMLAGRKWVIRQVVSPDGMTASLPQPGDTVWVREPWAYHENGSVMRQAERPDHAAVSWQAPRTMPREASRLQVTVVAARAERLREIPDTEFAGEGALWRSESQPPGESDRAGFARWWDSHHRRPGTRWADNPLVWVLQVARRQGG